MSTKDLRIGETVYSGVPAVKIQRADGGGHEVFVPEGTVPEGYVPEGTVPSGYVPEGTVPSGYVPTPSGTMQITANGTHGVAEYAQVDVNVPIPAGYVQPARHIAGQTITLGNAPQTLQEGSYLDGDVLIPAIPAQTDDVFTALNSSLSGVTFNFTHDGGTTGTYVAPASTAKSSYTLKNPTYIQVVNTATTVNRWFARIMYRELVNGGERHEIAHGESFVVPITKDGHPIEGVFVCTG